MKLIQQADVVLALGTRLGPFGTLPQYEIDYWPKGAKIIQVDADHKMLGLVRQIAVGICGDAKAAATAILARLQGKKLTCEQNKDKRLAEIKSHRITSYNVCYTKLLRSLFCSPHLRFTSMPSKA